MKQPYLTRLNNLAAAWPRVYNRIDKRRVQVIKENVKEESWVHLHSEMEPSVYVSVSGGVVFIYRCIIQYVLVFKLAWYINAHSIY